MRLESENLILELVDYNDINFILEIRQNHRHKKNLGKTVSTYKEQKEWLESYKKREKEGKDYYFKVKDRKENRIGLIRVYNIKQKSFEQGSLVLKEGLPANTILELLKLVYNFGFNTLEKENCIIRVKKINKVGNRFHKNYGAKKYKEDEELNYYSFNYNCIEKIDNLLKMIGE